MDQEAMRELLAQIMAGRQETGTNYTVQPGPNQNADFSQFYPQAPQGPEYQGPVQPMPEPSAPPNPLAGYQPPVPPGPPNPTMPMPPQAPPNVGPPTGVSTLPMPQQLEMLKRMQGNLDMQRHPTPTAMGIGRR